jgi:hypothetical protein
MEQGAMKMNNVVAKQNHAELQGQSEIYPSK